MECKHEPYWSKMQVNIEEFENFDKYAFYVRIGPPTEKYEDTPIFYQTVCVTRPTPPELIDHMFDIVKDKIKDYLKSNAENK